MYVHLERLVVLTYNKAVADAGKIGTVRGEVDIRLVLADDENGIECVGYLGGVEHIECAAFVCDGGVVDSLGGGLYLAFEVGKHSTEDDYVALAACVHHACLAQNRVLIDGVLKCFLGRLVGHLEHHLNILGGLCKLDCRCGSQACDREDSALGGLHDRLVGSLDTVVHGGGELLSADGLHALQSAGNATEQKRQDNAGVASCATQKSACDAVGHGIDGIVLLLAKLGGGGIHGKAHVRAGIAVGNGEHIQLVYHLCIFCKCRISAKYHILKRCGINVISQRKHLREEK